MTDKAIEDLGQALSGFVLALHRAPTAHEVSKFIREFIRARKNGRLVV